MTSSPEELWTRRLLNVGRELMTDVDLDAVLDRVLRTAQEITGARYAVAAPVTAPSATSPPPAAPKSTLKQPVRKSTLKRPARKAAKKRAKKHHSRAGGASTERTLARSALPNTRAAFTG